MNGQTRTIFRKWPEGDILALFPDLDHGYGGICVSYQHIGQHGGADYQHCIAATKPATPQEYAELASELTSIGYGLKIRQRR